MNQPNSAHNWNTGCRLPLDDWIWLNSRGIFEDPSLKAYVAPFPPSHLMKRIGVRTGKEQDFAAHGVTIFGALTQASPKPLHQYRYILDFGCGCGRLIRMFKGHPGLVVGCDIEHEYISWISKNLDFVKAVRTSAHPPLPFADETFDAIISISVFTHMSEMSQHKFLSELFRITVPSGILFLTIHGHRAMERAKTEARIFEMLNIDPIEFKKACTAFENQSISFIMQHENKITSDKTNGRKRLDQEPYPYGITFIPEQYIHKHWSAWFDIIEIRRGAIHDFQDIIVLRPKK